MACNCNRADCKAETNARGCCPFRRPYVPPPETIRGTGGLLASITGDGKARTFPNSGQTHEGQGMAWGPFDPN